MIILSVSLRVGLMGGNNQLNIQYGGCGTFLFAMSLLLWSEVKSLFWQNIERWGGPVALYIYGSWNWGISKTICWSEWNWTIYSWIHQSKHPSLLILQAQNCSNLQTSQAGNTKMQPSSEEHMPQKILIGTLLLYEIVISSCSHHLNCFSHHFSSHYHVLLSKSEINGGRKGKGGLY